MRIGEHGGCTSTKIQGCDGGEIWKNQAGLNEKRLDELFDFCFSQGMLMETAIRADSVAKGDVDVEMQSAIGLSLGFPCCFDGNKLRRVHVGSESCFHAWEEFCNCPSMEMLRCGLFEFPCWDG